MAADGQRCLSLPFLGCAFGDCEERCCLDRKAKDLLVIERSTEQLSVRHRLPPFERGELRRQKAWLCTQWRFRWAFVRNAYYCIVRSCVHVARCRIMPIRRFWNRHGCVSEEIDRLKTPLDCLSVQERDESGQDVSLTSSCLAVYRSCVIAFRLRTTVHSGSGPFAVSLTECSV